MADLLRLRELFARKIPSSYVRTVPELIQDFAEVLIRTGMFEVAVPVIDSYEQGEECSTGDVVAEIDRRLQQIIDREPRDRLDYLESLAARIGLRWRGNESKQQQSDREGTGCRVRSNPRGLRGCQEDRPHLSRHRTEVSRS
ncbi:hypothetical protein E1267_39645 [Nonomuraea longispora]|uniref:Uncharacterized protein n=1 Tax=Nonomuraea longispora TaxID=1848320 RepID=A0A4R4MNT5_9ACTN|nr:hypothetical protein [Nonomuraea longispora]TDB97650.1 hypothetical protein E1267_39645 [Nonomuraea longispora]